MQIKVKYTHTQYQEVANSLRRILQFVSENEYLYSDVDSINIIEGLEHIVKKMLSQLMLPCKKKYTLSLNNFEIWTVVNACMDYEPQDFERILLSDILLEAYNESRRLLEHRRNMKGNLKMQMKE